MADIQMYYTKKIIIIIIILLFSVSAVTITDTATESSAFHLGFFAFALATIAFQASVPTCRVESYLRKRYNSMRISNESVLSQKSN